MSLVADRGNNVPEYHDHDIGNHGGQTHLRFTNATISSRGFGGNPVTEWPSCDESYERTNKNGEIEEAYIRLVHGMEWSVAYVPIDCELML
jgi:hypothetical protein